MSRAIAFVILRGFYVGAAHQLYGLPGPLLVGSGNQVQEASPDLSHAGIRPGLSRREAAYAAPEAEWVEYDVGRFRPFAEAFNAHCASLTPRVEPVGGGEAFLDLTGAPGVSLTPSTSLTASPVLPSCLVRLAGDLRHSFCAPDLELRCGLAANRVVARLAAGQVTGEGCFTVPPGREAAFLAPFSPSALWTLSPAARETLVKLGLQTLEEARDVPESVLHRLLGAESYLLLRHAWGQDDSPVPFYDPGRASEAGATTPRRLSRELALPPAACLSEVAPLLCGAATELTAELGETGSTCLHLDVALVSPGGGGERRTKLTPREPPATAEALFTLLSGAAERLLAVTDPSGPARLVVEVTPARGAAQLPLLALTGPSVGSSAGVPARCPTALEEVAAAVNRAFPAQVLFPASLLSVSRRERLRRLLPGFGHAGP
ncbi:MAG: hypothetical protein ACM3UP_01575 [Methanocella sp.]